MAEWFMAEWFMAEWFMTEWFMAVAAMTGAICQCRTSQPSTPNGRCR
jgi:hypothetical protein